MLFDSIPLLEDILPKSNCDREGEKTTKALQNGGKYFNELLVLNKPNTPLIQIET